jgi:hypothetical protein
MAAYNLATQEYDFSNKNPNDVLTQDELEHFEEGMCLKNKCRPADEMDFGRAVDAVVTELDVILP